MLTKNVNETVKKKGRLGCCLIDSGQTGKSIYTAICLVQYWLPLKVDGTALKLGVSKVRLPFVRFQNINCIMNSSQQPKIAFSFFS